MQLQLRSVYRLLSVLAPASRKAKQPTFFRHAGSFFLSSSTGAQPHLGWTPFKRRPTHFKTEPHAAANNSLSSEFHEAGLVQSFRILSAQSHALFGKMVRLVDPSGRRVYFPFVQRCLLTVDVAVQNSKDSILIPKPPGIYRHEWLYL